MIKKRDINFDVLKIFAMMLIISGHYFTHTNLSKSDPLSQIGVVISIYKPIYVLGVNIFILITGYFQSENLFKKEKLFRIWKDVVIWSIICSIVGCIYQICYSDKISFVLLIKSFFPVFTREYWFISAYIVLYIISPYINKMIKLCTKKEIENLLFIMFVFFSLWPSVYSNSLDNTGGFGIIWFVVLYITGAYIRKFPIHINCKICFLGLILYEILMISIKYVSTIFLTNYVSGIDVMVNAVMYKYNFPLVYIASIFIFVLVSNFPINIFKNERIILSLSVITLDIYVIHENPFIREILWNNIIKIELIKQNIFACIFFAVVITAFVYALGYLLVELKRKTIDKLVFLRLSTKGRD